MTIMVKPVVLWGETRYRPICSEAKLIASLTGLETMSNGHIVTIKQLGWNVVTMPQVTL